MLLLMLFEVRNGSFEPRHIIAKATESGIAMLAEKAAHFSGGVVMVYVKGSGKLRLVRPTDGAASGLRLKHRIVRAEGDAVGALELVITVVLAVPKPKATILIPALVVAAFAIAAVAVA